MVYIKQDCPYVEPLELNLTTNSEGGFDPSEAYRCLTSVAYYGKGTREAKMLIKGGME